MPESFPENPYATPIAGTGDSAYYKTVANRATFRELWWNTRPNPLAFAVVSLFKVFRVPLPAQFGFAPELLEMHELEDLPPAAQEALAEMLEQLARLGFAPCFAESIPCVGDGEGHGVVLAHREGSIFASANWARMVHRCEVHLSLATLLNTGIRIATTNAPRRLLAPPGTDVEYLVGASVDDVLALHNRRLRENGDAWPVVLNDAELRQLVRDVERQTLEFHRDRGVWARMSLAELDRVRAAALR